jgi:hypothetical protein
MIQGITNKRKGSDAERYYVKMFKELGFLGCCTSRLGSRKYDNAKIDLMNLPFNVQIKAGIQKNMNPGKVLFEMKSAITTMFQSFEDVTKKPCILIHHKQGTKGVKRKEEDSIVYMSNDLYQSYMKKGIDNLPLVYFKTLKIDTEFEFKTIVGISFTTFVNNIILKEKETYVENCNSSSNTGLL